MDKINKITNQRLIYLQPYILRNASFPRRGFRLFEQCKLVWENYFQGRTCRAFSWRFQVDCWSQEQWYIAAFDESTTFRYVILLSRHLSTGNNVYDLLLCWKRPEIYRIFLIHFVFSEHFENFRGSRVTSCNFGVSDRLHCNGVVIIKVYSLHLQVSLRKLYFFEEIIYWWRVYIPLIYSQWEYK